MRITPHSSHGSAEGPELPHGHMCRGASDCPAGVNAMSGVSGADDAPGASGAEACSHCARTTQRNDREKAALVSRCNRVEGQIRGIRGMLERDAYCDDILHQIQAASAALDAMGRLVLERHMNSCLVERIQAGDLAVVDELLTTLRKMMR